MNPTGQLLLCKPSANSNAGRTRSARVLAFVRGWSPDSQPGVQVQALRQRVSAMGVDLIVAGTGDPCLFDGDGQFSRVDKLAADAAASVWAMSSQRGDAAFLILPERAIRLAYDGSLLDALDAAEELLAARAPRESAPCFERAPTEPRGVAA